MRSILYTISYGARTSWSGIRDEVPATQKKRYHSHPYAAFLPDILFFPGKFLHFAILLISIVKIGLPFLFCISVLLFAAHGRAQTREIDSIRKEIRLYDLKKAKRGEKRLTLGDSVKTELFDMLAVRYIDNFPDSAYVYLNKELELSNAIGYTDGKAAAKSLLGYYFDIKGDYKRAMAAYEDALTIYKTTENKRSLTDTYSNIGILYTKLNNYPEALRYALEALKVAKAGNDSYAIVAIYNNIGELCKVQKNNAEALRYYRLALTHSAKVNDDYMASLVNRNIGMVLLDEKKPAEAMKYFSKGLAHARRGDLYDPMAQNYEGIAGVKKTEGKFQETIDYYVKAFRLREITGNRHAINQSILSIGEAYYDAGNLDQALAYLNRGIAMADEMDYYDLLSQGHLSLSKVHVAKGEYKKAYEQQVLYKAMTDSVNSFEREESFNNLRMRYDYKSMRDSLGTIQLRKDLIAKEEVQQQKNTRNFVAIGGSLAVIFLIIVVVQRGKIARIGREKALQDERHRINRDLHDNLGAQLSTVRMYVSGLQDKEGHDAETVDNTIGLLDDSIHELRRIMNDEEHSFLHEEGLIAATAQLATKIHRFHEIVFELNHNFEARLPYKIEHDLFRILQELINNTLKYAGAGHISIELLQRDGKVVLFYEDDGNGFDPDKIKRGNGLSNIETRAASLGGTVEVDSKPGYGARTIIEIPLP